MIDLVGFARQRWRCDGAVKLAIMTQAHADDIAAGVPVVDVEAVRTAWENRLRLTGGASGYQALYGVLEHNSLFPEASLPPIF